MDINYYLLNPTGNITILVETPVPFKDRRFIADYLMKHEPSAEQVGFIVDSEDADMSVEMSGGEFCGNACLSAAFVCGKEKCVIRMSGTDDKILVENGTAHLPLPLFIGEENFFINGEIFEFSFVKMDGIAHIIIERDLPDCDINYLAKVWCDQLESDAVGLMFLKDDELKPFVYVKNADTYFWEHSCASGSCAVAAVKAAEIEAPVSLDLQEPGGVLHVEANGEELILSGKVELIKKDKVCIPEL